MIEANIEHIVYSKATLSGLSEIIQMEKGYFVLKPSYYTYPLGRLHSLKDYFDFLAKVMGDKLKKKALEIHALILEHYNMDYEIDFKARPISIYYDVAEIVEYFETKYKAETQHGVRIIFPPTMEDISIFAKKITTKKRQIQNLAAAMQFFERAKIVEVETLRSKFHKDYEIIKDASLDEDEKVALSAIRVLARMIGKHLLPKRQKRIVYIGNAPQAVRAWTDGETYIVIDRNILKTCIASATYSSPFYHIALLLLHEYAHDSSNIATHAHGLEFYERFHENAFRSLDREEENKSLAVLCRYAERHYYKQMKEKKKENSLSLYYEKEFGIKRLKDFHIKLEKATKEKLGYRSRYRSTDEVMSKLDYIEDILNNFHNIVGASHELHTKKDGTLEGRYTPSIKDKKGSIRNSIFIFYGAKSKERHDEVVEKLDKLFRVKSVVKKVNSLC